MYKTHFRKRNLQRRAYSSVCLCNQRGEQYVTDDKTKVDCVKCLIKLGIEEVKDAGTIKS